MLPNDSKNSSRDGTGCVGVEDIGTCKGRFGLLFEFCVNGIKKNGSIVLGFDELKEIGVIDEGVGVCRFSLMLLESEKIGKFGI